ncbi:MAG: PD-(D/E)XK nuclease family protein, partial [Kiritimatiellia bacterium]|nr:PD-(D/E)XK nuclease family protein [Kiritimatiellia bacterium]
GIEILVMAPKELQDHFDDWGRPLPEKWTTRLIDIPASEKNILIAGDPTSQAQSVLNLIHANEYCSNDIGIGVPDRAVIPYLQNKLESAGIAAFDPADRPLKDHHLYHLIEAWCRFTENASFKNLAAFLGKADILKYLQETRKINAFELLTELDQLQNKVLPLTMPDAESALTKTKENEFPNLKSAIKFTREILSAANSGAPQDALRFLLEQVFALKTITGGTDDDKDFKATASNISEILNDLTYTQAFTENFPAQLVNRLIVSRLDELSLPRHREGAMIDLNGWLELPWNDAPFMVITGFNEGQVPDSQKSDIFLPDSFKKTLGLRNNESRFARDAYLLSLIIAMRRQAGRVVLITGKTSPAGDPLKPSRLLFRCPDEQLAERAEFIFKEVEEKNQRPPFTVTFKLNPAAPLASRRKPFLPAELHATQFRDYLACPFRFFLKHILKMKRAGKKTELDALDFGTIIHAILEEFSSNPKINNSTDPALIQKHLTGLLADYFQQTYGNNHSFPILYAQAIAKQRLRAFAEHQAQASSEGWEIVAREQACQLTISGLKVAGKIDRVDKKRNEERMRIIDYKTSDSAENPAKQHIRESRKEIPDYARLSDAGNKRWNDLQLPLYRHMLKNMSLGKECKDIELCYFNLPKAISNSGLAVWENFTPELAESACKTAEKIITRIKQGVFWPPADSVKYDDFEPLFAEDMRDFFDGDMLEEFMKKHWRK